MSLGSSASSLDGFTDGRLILFCRTQLLERLCLWQTAQEAAMADPDHLNTIRRGVDAWNARRQREPRITPDLSEVRLIRADLGGANLSYTRLVEVDITNADLTGCRIYGVSAWELELRDETRQRNLIVTKGPNRKSRSTISRSHNLFT